MNILYVDQINLCQKADFVSTQIHQRFITEQRGKKEETQTSLNLSIFYFTQSTCMKYYYMSF